MKSTSSVSAVRDILAVRAIQTARTPAPIGGRVTRFGVSDSYGYKWDGLAPADEHKAGDTWTIDGVTITTLGVFINRGVVKIDGRTHTLLEAVGDAH